jgi:hypothetical protein
MATETTLLVSPEDEGLHPAQEDPLWSESLYLNFSDHNGQLGGFTRMALLAPKNETEGLLCLYLPDGGVGIVLIKDTLAQPVPNMVRAGQLSHECVEPLKRWRIRYSGDVHEYRDLQLGPPRPVELDLSIEGLHTPFYYPNYRKVTAPPPHRPDGAGLSRKLVRAWRRPGEIRLALRMRSGRHYEQSMRIHGTVTLDGQRLPFDGGGHRDHSWGLRHWGLPQRWRWLTGQWPDFAFNAMYITIAGSHLTNGYVWHEGQCSAVEHLTLDTSFDETGIAGRDVRLELTAGGKKFTLTGNVLMNVPLPMPGKDYSSMYAIGRTRYRYEDRIGYGVTEFFERIYP